MTNYYINEAILSFSGNISQDSTLNMIRLSDPDAALIISRGKMQDGDELASQVEQQMKNWKSRLRNCVIRQHRLSGWVLTGKWRGWKYRVSSSGVMSMYTSTRRYLCYRAAG